MTTTWSATSKNAHAVLSNGSLTAATDGAATHSVGIATSVIGVGVKIYWEAPINTSAAPHEIGSGLANASQTFADDDFMGNSAFSIGAYNDGAVYKNFSGTLTQFATVGTFNAGDTQCLAAIGGSKLWVRINGGNWNNDILANQDPANNIGGLDISDLGAVFPAFDAQNTGKLTANFGATALAFPVPGGFTTLDQIPAPPVVVANVGGGFQYLGRHTRDELFPEEEAVTVATTEALPVKPPSRKMRKRLAVAKKQPVVAVPPVDDEEEEAMMIGLAA